MKKVIFGIIGAVLVFGLFAGAGFAGYRIGYTRGVQASANGDAPLFGPERMPMPNFGRDSDRGFDRGFPHRGFQMMQRGRGFGMISPLMFLPHIAIWALIIGLVFLLFTRSGWQLSRTKQSVQDRPATVETEVNPQEPTSENE